MTGATPTVAPALRHPQVALVAQPNLCQEAKNVGLECDGTAGEDTIAGAAAGAGHALYRKGPDDVAGTGKSNGGGGGGGSGYYGGGGGGAFWTYMGGGGGGGSSYFAGGTAIAGTGATPGGIDHALYDGTAGQGGISGAESDVPSTDGYGGLIVITY